MATSRIDRYSVTYTETLLPNSSPTHHAPDRRHIICEVTKSCYTIYNSVNRAISANRYTHVTVGPFTNRENQAAILRPSYL